jgi:hypothetical protein
MFATHLEPLRDEHATYQPFPERPGAASARDGRFLCASCAFLRLSSKRFFQQWYRRCGTGRVAFIAGAKPSSAQHVLERFQIQHARQGIFLYDGIR